MVEEWELEEDDGWQKEKIWEAKGRANILWPDSEQKSLTSRVIVYIY